MKLLFVLALLCILVAGIFALPRKRELDGLGKERSKRSRDAKEEAKELRQIEKLIRNLKDTPQVDATQEKDLELESQNQELRGKRPKIERTRPFQVPTRLTEKRRRRLNGDQQNPGLSEFTEKRPRGMKGGKKNPGRGKGLGHLFDKPQDIASDSELEVILDSFVIMEGKNKKHKAFGVHRKDDYGDDHDEHKRVQPVDGKKRNFLLDQNKFWSNKIIPYEIAGSFSSSDIAIIEQGIQEFNDLTCVKWVPRGSTSEPKYVRIISGSGCWSYVGSVAHLLSTNPYQELSLAVPGCISVGTTVHEMLHAAGAEHEQSRVDRDNYLDMIWSNLDGGTGNINYQIGNTDTYNPWDAESVLQYYLRASSLNGQRTMKLKDWRLEFLVDSVDGFAFYDVKDVTVSYNCNSSCTDLGCQNAGFMDWQCQCYCPKDLTGTTCTDTVSIGSCGGTVTVGAGQEVYIESPNYPANYNTGLKCTWLVEGVPDNILRATIVDLDISNNGIACYHWLEFRYNLLGQAGPRRCGVTTNEVWDVTKEEFKNKMILQFDSYTGSDKPATKGFKIKFESIGTGCINNPCMFGSCYSPLNTDQYTCTCYSGFSGTNCDTPSTSASIGCTAEVGEYCMLTQSTNDNFDWDLQTAKPDWGSSGYGPERAYEGWVYLYVDGSQQSSGYRAEMYTTLSFPYVDRCLRFRYFKQWGSSYGTLNVYTENSQGSRTNVFTQSAAKGKNWIAANVDIPATNGLKVIFEAVVGSSSYTDMALDDIWLIPGTCANPITTSSTSTTTTTTSPTTTTTTLSPSTTTSTVTTTTPSTTTTTSSTTTTSPGGSTPFPVPPGANVCEFEPGETSCLFLNTLYNDYFDWTFYQGPTPTGGTGPDYAYTTSYYAYIEVDGVANNAMARLTTESFYLTANTVICVQFAYHMFGQPGTLEISVGNYGEATTVIKTLYGDYGYTWQIDEIQIPDTYYDPVINFDASRGNSNQGDIAVDRIVLAYQPCTGTTTTTSTSSTTTTTLAPTTTTTPATTTTSPTTTTTTPSTTTTLSSTTTSTGQTTPFPVPSNSFLCEFEPGEQSCVFENTTNGDDFDWTYNHQGTTLSQGTGPDQAYTGTYYAYIEVSDPIANFARARLTTENYYLSVNTAMCVKFAFHMYGVPGALDVLVGNWGDTTFTTLQTFAGNYGPTWQIASVQVPDTYYDPVIILEGSRGTDWKGDIAVDRLYIVDGTC